MRGAWETHCACQVLLWKFVSSLAINIPISSTGLFSSSLNLSVGLLFSDFAYKEKCSGLSRRRAYNPLRDWVKNALLFRAKSFPVKLPVTNSYLILSLKNVINVEFYSSCVCVFVNISEIWIGTLLRLLWIAGLGKGNNRNTVVTYFRRYIRISIKTSKKKWTVWNVSFLEYVPWTLGVPVERG